MSRFYGTLDGSRGQATRCGTASSGMRSIAASWSGAAMATTYTKAWFSSADDTDCATLDLTTWHGAGRRLFVYDGPVNPSDDEFFAGLLPGAPADWLRKAAVALMERANKADPEGQPFVVVEVSGGVAELTRETHPGLCAVEIADHDNEGGSAEGAAGAA